MSELFRDPAWTFVGAFLGLLALVAMVGIYLAQRRVKRLSYEVTTNAQLLGVDDEIEGKVKILYDGEEVANVHLITVRCVNAGNQPISSSDYDRPVSFLLDQDSRLLSGEIIDEVPENLNASLNLSDGLVFIDPVLLNPKDEFTVKILVGDFKSFNGVDGRIHGVKRISRYKETSFAAYFRASCLLIFGSALIIGFGEDATLFGIGMSPWIIGGFLFFAAYSFLVMALLKNKRFLRAMSQALKN